MFSLHVMDRTSNGLTLQHKIFKIKIKKNFWVKRVKHKNRLPEEVMQFVYLKVFNKRPDKY